MLVNNDTNIYAGATNVSKIYQGENAIYEKQVAPPYTPLNYIQSTGTQYIDTGYSGKGYSQFEISFSATSKGFVYGGYDSTSKVEQGVGFYHNHNNPGSTSQKEWFHYKSNTQLPFSSTTETETVVTNGGTIYINDVLQTQIASKEFTITNPVYVFTGNKAGRMGDKIACKLYYFKIKENDVLLHDFIPVLDENSVPCLFDKITNTFHYNIGTGTFNYG